MKGLKIKEATFDLAKRIWEFDFIEDFRKLIFSLNFTDGHSFNNRSNYGYAARRQNAQVWGYLLVNLKRDEINKLKYITVPIIESFEIEILEKAHLFIYEFNRILINRHFGSFNNVKRSLQVYNHKENDFKFSINKYFDNKIYERLLGSFSDTLSLRNILDTNMRLVQNIKFEHVYGFIEEMDKRIINAGVFKSPTDFDELRFNNRQTDVEKELQRFLFSVLVLKKQIQLVNQLLYQAFLTTKLVSFDENNIYDIKNFNQNTIGTGLQVFIQPNSEEVFLDVGDIIFLDINYGNQIKDLAFVEGKKTNFSKETGTNEIYDLRIINDDLNPYSNLLEILK